jgi:hypothetical protein
MIVLNDKLQSILLVNFKIIQIFRLNYFDFVNLEEIATYFYIMENIYSLK